MAAEKTNIGNAKMKEVPKNPLSFILKDKAVKNKHLDDGSVDTRVLKDKAVTPEKRSDNFDNEVIKPYVNAVDNKYSTITNQIDGKYKDITEELYSMVASLQVGGIALSGKFGNRTDIGIHQKALTKALGRLWDEIASITGKTYMDFDLTVQPTQIWAEGTGTVTVIADCSDAISDFDNIKVYVNGVLKAESHDITRYQVNLDITENSIIKVDGTIMGKMITKTETVYKSIPFFMGSGMYYTEVMIPECHKELIGTLEGDYDVTIKHTGDYMFIIIPISHKDEFRRADMNGLGLKVEIPMQATVTPDYVVYKSLNTYQAGTYNIDIDINS